MGLMMNGLVISNMVVGGPAYSCAELHRGDVIVKVDGVDVAEDTFTNAVIGEDIPVLFGKKWGGGGVRRRERYGGQ